MDCPFIYPGSVHDAHQPTNARAGAVLDECTGEQTEWKLVCARRVCVVSCVCVVRVSVLNIRAVRTNFPAITQHQKAHGVIPAPIWLLICLVTKFVLVAIFFWMTHRLTNRIAFLGLKADMGQTSLLIRFVGYLIQVLPGIIYENSR